MRCSASEYNPHDGVEATVVDTIVQSTDALEWNVTVESGTSFFWTAPVIMRTVLPAYDDNATSVWLGGAGRSGRSRSCCCWCRWSWSCSACCY